MSGNGSGGKGSRFAGQLAALSGKPVAEEDLTPPLKATSKAGAGADDDLLETFSSHMTKSRKRRLKFASVKEERKIYEIVGELVEEYLKRNHPELK